MLNISLKLTGWKAYVALAVFLVGAGWVGFRYVSPPTSLPPEATKAIKVMLTGIYTQKLMAQFGMTPEKTPSRPDAEKFAQRIKELEQMEISDLRVRGFGRKRVAQMRVSIAGDVPPDQQEIRYMRLTWSPLMNSWTAFQTTDRAYQLTFW